MKQAGPGEFVELTPDELMEIVALRQLRALGYEEWARQEIVRYMKEHRPSLWKRIWRRIRGRGPSGRWKVSLDAGWRERKEAAQIHDEGRGPNEA